MPQTLVGVLVVCTLVSGCEGLGVVRDEYGHGAAQGQACPVETLGNVAFDLQSLDARETPRRAHLALDPRCTPMLVDAGAADRASPRRDAGIAKADAQPRRPPDAALRVDQRVVSGGGGSGTGLGSGSGAGTGSGTGGRKPFASQSCTAQQAQLAACLYVADGALRPSEVADTVAFAACGVTLTVEVGKAFASSLQGCDTPWDELVRRYLAGKGVSQSHAEPTTRVPGKQRESHDVCRCACLGDACRAPRTIRAYVFNPAHDLPAQRRALAFCAGLCAPDGCQATTGHCETFGP